MPKMSFCMTNPIPEISNRVLKKRAKRIKPVFRFVNESGKLTQVDVYEPAYKFGVLLYVEQPWDLRNQAMNYDLKPTGLANDISTLDRILTYHTMSARFNPSVAEVLAQIPPRLLRQTVAYEVTHKSPISYESFGLESFHKTMTILYKKK